MPWVGIVDKHRRTLIKIDCPLSDETQCTDLLPVPDFNSVNFPFLFQRNSKAINLVNIGTMSMNRLISRTNQAGSFQKMVIHIDKAMND